MDRALDDMIDGLVKKGLLKRDHEKLALTPAGRARVSDVAIQIGDRVRSYDFSRDGPYVEGAVLRFEEMEGCIRYVIKVDVDMWPELPASSRTRCGMLVYPPVNGTPKLMGGVCSGVERLGVESSGRRPWAKGRTTGLRHRGSGKFKQVA